MTVATCKSCSDLSDTGQQKEDESSCASHRRSKLRPTHSRESISVLMIHPKVELSFNLPPEPFLSVRFSGIKHIHIVV